ncbi:carbamoyltransferase HypF, partial [candidate division GN15 bacterium]|nr:carbamoyltransferase HypF [candidate division GN15 bacterium]
MRTQTKADQTRVLLTVGGTVQGVGFRPFVYRLAGELGLRGSVRNSPAGVAIDIQGPPDAVAQFVDRLHSDKPAVCSITGIQSEELPLSGATGFEIASSGESGKMRALILPDLALCEDCRREMFDPADRRYRYPFINCTNCGPRYSIITGLPYDRPSTAMAGFDMCDACRAEYQDPANRRFHAQPIACPDCGPHVAFWGCDGAVLADRDEALSLAGDAISDGRIVGVKGLGGFHLMVDATNKDAVARLRKRKHRDAKPLAVMFPSLDTLGQCCRVSEAEAKLVTSVISPIVLAKKLAKKLPNTDVADNVAPDNPYLGAMLPYTPLHVLLLQAVGKPVVATSGNMSEEPICIDEREVLRRLGNIADCYLVHNRPIARHVDDSVVRLTREGVMVLRRARGYAPLPIQTAESLPSVLAVGGHMKNTIAVSVGGDVFLSQHIGDLETVEALSALRQTIDDLPRLYDATPGTVACDMHPDYASTQLAQRSGGQVTAVQHHYAHVLSCMAEHHLEPPVLGVSWDGTGYGPDGTVWGGEFLQINEDGYRRVARVRPFRLPGGEAAVREPRRSALGLLHEVCDGQFNAHLALPPMTSFAADERTLLQQTLVRQINSPQTSSVGRLFDGVAALLGLQQVA